MHVFHKFYLLYVFGGIAKVEKTAFVVGKVCIREVQLYYARVTLLNLQRKAVTFSELKFLIIYHRV